MTQENKTMIKGNTNMNRRNFNRKMATTLGGGMILGQVGACKTLADILGAAGIQKPSVKVANMKITSWSLDTLGTVFDIIIDNPNSMGLNLASIGYGILVNGNTLANGNSTKGVQLKAKGQSMTQLAFNFPLAQTAQGLLSLLKNKSVGYGLETSLGFNAAGTRFNIPMNHNGSLNLPSIPKIGMPSFKVSGIDRSGNIGLRVTPEFNNSNGFDLPLGGLVSSVKLNNRPIVNNAVQKLHVLKKNQKTPVPIDLKANVAQLGMSVLDLFKKPTVNWDLDLGLKSGKFKLPFNRQGKLRLA